MEFHIESATQDFSAQGIPEEEARNAARRRFGNMTRIAEDARFTWIAQWISDLGQDLRYAFRGMRRNAGFTTFTILIVGLGIGASSTVFSLVNAVLLRPLPFHDPQRLVWLENQEALNIQVNHFVDLQERNKSLSDLAGFGGVGDGEIELAGSAGRERLTSSRVTQNFFSLLGVQPMIGRLFTADECRQKESDPPAVLLSHGFWLRRFASNPAVVGRPLILNNKPVLVVGVLPASFDFASIFAPGTPVDVFTPWPLTPETSTFGNTTQGLGRLQPGATVQSAQAEFTVLGKQLDAEHPTPERNPVTPRVSPLAQHVSGRVRPALVVLACAVGVVMLIVCANLANLQLARLTARHKEMAMRTALGAGRFRLLRQMITESVTLSCCGAVLGLILAVTGAREIAHIKSFNLPLLATVQIDGRGLAFTLLAAIVTGVLFGLLPALQASSSSVREGLEDASRGSTGGKRQAWIRDGLVICEIAFACTLLVGAGLLMRSFLRVLDVKLGFQPERAAALRIDPSFPLTTLQQQNSFIDDALNRVRSAPGITSAGIADVLPFRGDRGWSVSVKGHVYVKTPHPEPYIRVVTDGYFEAAGIPLRTGRLFTGQDRAASQPVVIINETMARTAFPGGEDPLGQTITTYRGDKILGVVVGVVADVRHSALEEASGPEMYQALRQTADYSEMQLVVRTAVPLDRLAQELRTALRPVDPNLPVSDLQTLQDLVNKAISPRRALLLLLGGFAGFALLLASLGIYAVISYSVSQRVQEIGIRMALGASLGDIQSRVVLRTLSLAGFGVVLGLIASRALSRGLGSLLFGVTAGDPATFAGIAAILTIVAALAGYIPAWRASRIDPMIALRSS
jgi:predicted permease